MTDEILHIVSKFRKAFLSSYDPSGQAPATEYQADQLTLVKNITQMFLQTSTYSSMLETAFLQKTREFFRQQSDVKIENLPVSEYITFGMAVIQVESNFAYFYLEEDSFLRATECLEEELFRQHQETIMKGLSELIASYPSSADTLKTLFEIVEQTEMMPRMVTAWRKYITDVG